MRTITFFCVVMFFTNGCQVTSGKVDRVQYSCNQILKASDYIGDKPTWNDLGPITKIEKCDSGTYSTFKFFLQDTIIRTQMSSGDEMGFYETSEESFREILSSSKNFRSIANQIRIKNIEVNGKLLFYSVTIIRNRPVIYFVMNDGYQMPQMPPLWSMAHSGQLSGSASDTSNEFESWFLDKINNFRNEGGNYSSAFKGHLTSTDGTPHSIQKTNLPSGSTKNAVLKWSHLPGDFKGQLRRNKNATKGTMLFINDTSGLKCKGEFEVWYGSYGTWKLDCGSDKNLASSEGILKLKSGHIVGEGTAKNGAKVAFRSIE